MYYDSGLLYYYYLHNIIGLYIPYQLEINMFNTDYLLFNITPFTKKKIM